MLYQVTLHCLNSRQISPEETGQALLYGMRRGFSQLDKLMHVVWQLELHTFLARQRMLLAF